MNPPGGNAKNELLKKVAFAITSASLLLVSILTLRIIDTFRYIHLDVLLKALGRLWPAAG